MQSHKHTKQTYKTTGHLLRALGQGWAWAPISTRWGCGSSGPQADFPDQGLGSPEAAQRRPGKTGQKCRELVPFGADLAHESDDMGSNRQLHSVLRFYQLCSCEGCCQLQRAPPYTVFYSILFYSILFYSILFYSIMYHITPSLHPFISRFPFPHFCFPGIAPPSEVLIPTLCPCLVFWEAWVKTTQLG